MQSDDTQLDFRAEYLAHLSAWMPLLTGVLLAMCLALEDCAWLAWVALAPLAIAFSVRSINSRVFVAAVLGGVAFHVAGLAWISRCYAGDAILGPFTPVLLLAGVIGGLWFTAAFWWGRRLVQRTRLPMTLLLPLIWTMYELSRELVHHSIDGSGAPWLNLALTQMNTLQLAQIIDLGGQHTLTLLIGMVNGALFDAAVLVMFVARNTSTTSKVWRAGAVASAVALLLVTMCYGHWRLQQQADRDNGPVVALMPKVDVPPVPRSAQHRWQFSGQQPDLLVWSESAYHHRLLPGHFSNRGLSQQSIPQDVVAIAHGLPLTEYASLSMQHLQEASRQSGAAVLIGCQTLEEGRDAGTFSRRNSLAFVDYHGAAGGLYHKIHLVPWRETTPHARSADARRQPTKFNPGSDAPIFELHRKPAGNRAAKYRFGCALCYDVCFPRQFRSINFSGDGPPNFYVQCGSEGQDGGLALSRTMLNMARMRAIENRRAIVRNAENGYSGVIDGNGRFVQCIGPDEMDAPRLLSAVPIDDRSSFYATHGEWLPFALCLVALLLQVGSLTTRRYLPPPS